MKRSQGGLVFKAHKLFVSLNSRREEEEEEGGKYWKPFTLKMENAKPDSGPGCAIPYHIARQRLVMNELSYLQVGTGCEGARALPWAKDNAGGLNP